VRVRHVLEKNSAVVWASRHSTSPTSHPHVQRGLGRRDGGQEVMSEATQPPLDAVAIARLLPHRFPFLLIDRVTELPETRSSRSRTSLSMSRSSPVTFPASDHAGRVDRRGHGAGGRSDGMTALGQLRHPPRVLHGHRQVNSPARRAGDQLRLEVVPLRKGGAIWKLKGQAFVDGKLAPRRVLATLSKK